MTWWLIAVLGVVAVVVANVTVYWGYAWIPGSVVVVAFVALWCDIGVRHRLARAGLPSGSKAAAPWYVGLLASLATVVAVTSVLATLLVIGLSNGYMTPVTLQEEQASSPASSPTVTVNLVQGEDRICGGDESFSRCLDMHAAMYNSVCLNGGWRASLGLPTSFSASAVARCDDLAEFLDGAYSELRSCGSGCTTRANDDGLWGWPYLHPVAETQSTTSDDGVDPIVYNDRCWFSLGPIELGACRSG